MYTKTGFISLYYKELAFLIVSFLFFQFYSRGNWLVLGIQHFTRIGTSVASRFLVNSFLEQILTNYVNEDTMDFDLSKVYTAANADGLHVGDEVVLADTMADLRMKVAEVCDCKTRLTEIGAEDLQYRFRNTQSGYTLAYLIDSIPSLKWTELKIGDIIKTKDGSITRMVTGINANDDEIHIETGFTPISDVDLAEDWVKCE